VDESLFDVEEERALHTAAQVAAAQIKPDMSIPDFLQVSHRSISFLALAGSIMKFQSSNSNQDHVISQRSRPVITAKANVERHKGTHDINSCSM